MPRGGHRTSAPGTLHPNRSDMTQAPQANRGQPYGTRTKQLQSQAIQPVAGRPMVTSDPSAPETSSTTPSPSNVAPTAPGTIPSLSDPTAYPGEPVTAGLPNSPGVGPEALSVSAQAFAPEELSIVRNLYGKYRSDSLYDLLQFMESRL